MCLKVIKKNSIKIKNCVRTKTFGSKKNMIYEYKLVVPEINMSQEFIK